MKIAIKIFIVVLFYILVTAIYNSQKIKNYVIEEGKKPFLLPNPLNPILDLSM